MTGVFITGTDTGIGKTQVTVALMDWLRERGLRVAGMKPVASGCEVTPDGLRNEDAVALLQAASVALDYDQVNPYAYRPPIAPHLAARLAGLPIDPERVQSDFADLKRRVDIVLVEGVGGWEVPLADDFSVSDLARRLRIPVILVIGMRLGCLNHALLTHEAILRSGVECAGWIANDLTGSMDYLEENLETLRSRLSSPCLALLPHLAQGERPCGRHVRTRLEDREILRRFRL